MTDEAPRHDPDRPVYEHAWEDKLEPMHLIRRAEVVARVGAEMMVAGTGARRVRETMAAVASALDLDSVEARVEPTHIVATVKRRGVFRTEVTELAEPGVNADKIAALQHFGAHLPAHTTVAEVEQRLDEITARPPRWPAWAPPVGAGVACCAFAFLNHAGWIDVLAVFVAACAGQWLRHQMRRWQVTQLVNVFVAAIAAGVVFEGANRLLALAFGVPSPQNAAGFISAILFLIPGFPLITATLDLARLDLPSGISRFTYAALVTFAAGFAAWLVGTASGVSTVIPASPDMAPGLLLALRLLASFAGVFGFAVVFNSPPLVALASGAIALLANPMRIYLVSGGLAPQTAAATSTLLIGLLAFVAGRLFRLPRIILSVPSVVIMVPGADAFRSLVLLNSGHLTEALEPAVRSALTIVGMVAGLVAARILSDPRWTFRGGERPRLLHHDD